MSREKLEVIRHLFSLIELELDANIFKSFYSSYTEKR